MCLHVHVYVRVCVCIQIRKEGEFTQDVAARMAEELEAQSAGTYRPVDERKKERRERKRKKPREFITKKRFLKRCSLDLCVRYRRPGQKKEENLSSTDRSEREREKRRKDKEERKRVHLNSPPGEERERGEDRKREIEIERYRERRFHRDGVVCVGWGGSPLTLSLYVIDTSSPYSFKKAPELLSSHTSQTHAWVHIYIDIFIEGQGSPSSLQIYLNPYEKDRSTHTSIHKRYFAPHQMLYVLRIYSYVRVVYIYI